jgi:hypothetical protein
MSDFKDILLPIAELLEAKDRDYGLSFDLLRNEYGPTSFYIRMSDKLNRIKHVDKNGPVVNETVLDTLRDMVGYAALEIRHRMAIQELAEDSGFKVEVKNEGQCCFNCEYVNTESQAHPHSECFLMAHKNWTLGNVDRNCISCADYRCAGCMKVNKKEIEAAFYCYGRNYLYWTPKREGTE